MTPSGVEHLSPGDMVQADQVGSGRWRRGVAAPVGMWTPGPEPGSVPGPQALAMIAVSPAVTTVFASTDAISRPSPQPSPSLSATVGLVPYALYSPPSLMPSPAVSAFAGALPIVA